MYGVGKALYGTKDAPRDYHMKVDNIMINELQFRKLPMRSKIYIYEDYKGIVLVLDHVDDFIFTGSPNQLTESKMRHFKEFAVTELMNQ